MSSKNSFVTVFIIVMIGLCYGLGIKSRGDVISSENYLQRQQLSPDEIDPDVSPPKPSGNITDLDNNSIDPVEIVEEINPINTDDANPINKYCKCSLLSCNCCRHFQIPFVPVRGPACATINYVGQDRMTITLKYSDIVLASRSISSKNSRPICIPMPGGFTQFCGKVYGLSRDQNDFKACLGLELRNEENVEAKLRVSCFKFGSKGLSIAEAEPFPPEEEKNEEEDDSIFFGGDDDDDDNDDDDDDSDAEDNEVVNDDDDDDDDNQRSPVMSEQIAFACQNRAKNNEICNTTQILPTKQKKTKSTKRRTLKKNESFFELMYQFFDYFY